MKNQINTSLRIDRPLYSAIVKLAQENERSIHSQVIYMLKCQAEALKQAPAIGDRVADKVVLS